MKKESPIVKPRTPKPPPTDSVKWFLKFGIPFCHAKNYADRLLAARDIFNDMGGEEIPSSVWERWMSHDFNSDANQHDLLMAWMETMHFIRHEAFPQKIKASHTICVGKIFPRFPPFRFDFSISDIQNAAYNYMRPYIIWSADTKKFDFRIRPRNEREPLSNYFALAVKTVLLTKYLKAMEHDPGEKPVGNYYFSCCQFCEIPFEKRRNNQIYCSHRCAERQSHRDYRKRLKE